MGRAMLAVVAGYVAMFAAVFLTFSAAYLGMGQERAFRPGSYETSGLWLAVSFALGLLAAVLGGYVCAAIARSGRTPPALAGVVLALGLLAAVPVLTAGDGAGEARSGDVSNLDAMQKARQPVWVALLNPVVGAVGVLLGARLRGAGQPNSSRIGSPVSTR